MKFFEGMRRRALEREQASARELAAAQGRLESALAQSRESERSLAYTRERNAETWPDTSKIVELELRQQLVKTYLDSANASLSHLEQMEVLNERMRERQTELARLRGEAAPATRSDASNLEARRQKCAELQRQYDEITAEISDARKRITDRETELRARYRVQG